MKPVFAKIEKNGRLIIDKVDVSIEMIIEPSGLNSWHGYFESNLAHRLEPDEYQLVLEDGRRGEIIINHLTITGGSTSVPVTFIGSGPLE